MKPITNLHCPYCEIPVQVEKLGCHSCGVKLEGSFQPNEFAYLMEEDLHFLRIFLECEGRVRDMEAPLGLSYPTIRTRLAALKEKVLREPSSAPAPPAPPSPPKAPGSAHSPLDALAEGSATFEETLNQLKKQRGKK